MAQTFSQQFYKSNKWLKFRNMIISERGAKCEICGKHIVNSKSIHVHHITELTTSNINDVAITLNPDNVQVICHECHNKIHERYCKGAKKEKTNTINIVYGPPLAGKSTYVLEHMCDNDLIVDMDRLYKAISFKALYDKPEKLKYNVFAIKNLLIDNIKTRYGNFNNAWIIGGYPNKYDRERLSKELGANLIYIEADKLECYSRLDYCNDYRQNHKEMWQKYIDKWFENYIK